MQVLNDHCTVPNPDTIQCTAGNHRRGIIIATHQRLTAILGEPNTPASCDGKVGEHWTLHTSDGPITIYHFDLNVAGHYSIGARNDAAIAHFLPVARRHCLPVLSNDDYYEYSAHRISW
jgi:hypothetical protein